MSKSNYWHADVEAVTFTLLQLLEGGQREGLKDTPTRVAKAWNDWTRGYVADVPGLLKQFEDGADGYDGMVIQTDIPVYSKCEHHLADIFGVAHVAYIPAGRVVGLSKIARVVDAFARRLQVQERMTVQIADALLDGLNPRGVAVVLDCRHMCMESRGINRPGIVTRTTALRGAFRDQVVREEFLLAVGPQRRV
jgi:GTP cyclohydrolase IA